MLVNKNLQKQLKFKTTKICRSNAQLKLDETAAFPIIVMMRG